jgi:hypothetical protein
MTEKDLRGNEDQNDQDGEVMKRNYPGESPPDKYRPKGLWTMEVYSREGRKSYDKSGYDKKRSTPIQPALNQDSGPEEGNSSHSKCSITW